HQVPVGVVDPLEEVQVQEEQAERDAGLRGGLHLPLQDQLQVAHVEQPGVVVQVGQVLHLGEAAQVPPGERQVLAEEGGGGLGRLRDPSGEEQHHPPERHPTIDNKKHPNVLEQLQQIQQHHQLI